MLAPAEDEVGEAAADALAPVGDIGPVGQWPAVVWPQCKIE